MENSDDKEPKLSTSNIVTIAYCVSMFNQSKKIAGDDGSENSLNEEEKINFRCVNRVKSLPIIVGMTSSISGAYDSLKKSHDTIETILNTTEGQLNEGVKILTPVTSTIGNIFEKPLKSVDNAICDGFDYLGEKVPQLKSESEQIYENVGEYIKIASDSVMNYSSSLVTNIKGESENEKDDKSSDTNKPKQD